MNSSGRRRKTVQPEDILPRMREKREQQFNSIEDQVAALKMLYGAQQFETE